MVYAALGTKCSADTDVSTVGRGPAAVGLRGPQVASRAVIVRKSTWQKRKHMADVSMCKRSLRTPRNKCRRRGGGRSQ